MTASAVNETKRMVITREFDAPRELVWKAWTDPKYAKQWWGPKGFTVPVYQTDFRVGGRFLICMRSPEGQEFWNGGEYKEIVPNEKIEYTMYFSDPDGNKVEAAAYGMDHEAIDGANDVVTVESLGEGRTRITLIGNESMETAEKSGQVAGWNKILDKLAAVLAGVA